MMIDYILLLWHAFATGSTNWSFIIKLQKLAIVAVKFCEIWTNLLD